MDTGKPAKTLADYLVIAISPVLIMLLVHSLCFFLVEVFYRSEAVTGVRWVLFWFVLAAVLITRIGIEQGDTQAMVYGLALAGATWAYLAVVQHDVVFGAILLGVVWFTAHKLTTNCTLIDEEADASGQGLLASLRAWRFNAKSEGRNPKPERNPKSEGRMSRFKRYFGQPEDTAAEPARGSAPKPKPARPAAPGSWLLYYSAAALPIFGLGQMLLPAGNLAARRLGFIYLFGYLAAALGLLLTTSFLGLRRYLRQRYLGMPDHIALGWIRIGVVAAVVVLGLAALLPRPGAGEAWVTLRYQVDYQLRRASEYAARFNPHGSGAGREGHETDAHSNPDGTEGNSGTDTKPDAKPEVKGSQDSSGTGDQTQGAPGNSGATGDHGGAGGNGNGGQSRGGLPDLSPAARTVYGWLRVVFWLGLVAGLGGLCYRYRVFILTALSSAWAALRNFINVLLGRFALSAAGIPAPVKSTTVPPFRAFKNPFLTGGDQVWSPEKLIAYSYDALQSWALEQAPGGLPQTPREFCRQLGEEIPAAANALEHLAFLYGHVAYGASVPGSYNPDYLRLLWTEMAQPRPVRAEMTNDQ